MNERIKELAMQADIWCDQNYPNNEFYDIRWEEKFAELIVAECKENFAKVWYEQGLDIQGAELGKFLTRFEETFWS